MTLSLLFGDAFEGVRVCVCVLRSNVQKNKNESSDLCENVAPPIHFEALVVADSPPPPHPLKKGGGGGGLITRLGGVLIARL